MIIINDYLIVCTGIDDSGAAKACTTFIMTAESVEEVKQRMSQLQLVNHLDLGWEVSIIQELNQITRLV